MNKTAIAVFIMHLFSFCATPVMARDASDIFRRSCSHCHGYKGDGIRGLTATLKGSEFVVRGSDADVRATIKNGRTGAAKKFKNYPVVMYPNTDLNDAEIDALVRYLKTEIQK